MRRITLTFLAMVAVLVISASQAFAASWEGTFEYHNAGTEPGFAGVVNGTYTGNGSLSSGVYGKATGTNGNALMGWAQGTYGRGVYAEASGSEGTAVYGTTNGTEGWGVHGTSSGTEGRGVYGYASGTDSYGVYGYNYRNVGVRGYTYYGRDGVQGAARIANGRGVYGDASGSEGIGVFGHATNTGSNALTAGVKGVANSGNGVGVKGTAKGSRGIGVNGFAYSGNRTNYGGYFQSNSQKGRGVFGYAAKDSGTNIGVLGKTNSPNGYGVYSIGKMRVRGNFTVTGTKSAVVKVGQDEQVLLYAEESTENWFADYGTGDLIDGKAVIQIDPLFKETVNTENEYHVFLTPKGDCNGLFVTNETPGSFEVRELGGGESDIAFSYRIVVKRKGYESERLAKVSKTNDLKLDQAFSIPPEKIDLGLAQK